MAPKLVTASKKPAQPPVQAFRSPEAQFRDAVVLLHRVKGLEVEIANIQRDLMSSEDEEERIELFAGLRETWEKLSQLNLQFQRLPASLRDKAVNQQDDEAQEMLASNLAWSKAYQHAESAADEEGEVLTTEELDLVATIGVESTNSDLYLVHAAAWEEMVAEPLLTSLGYQYVRWVQEDKGLNLRIAYAIKKGVPYRLVY